MIFGTQYPMIARWDASGVRAYAREVEAAGFDFVAVSGHVLSSPSGRYPDKPARSYEGPYYDPLLLFTYLAGATDRLRFRTSVLILPLFPTALLAKQVAELSLLSNGRVELGVSISWNEDEYRALGQDVHQRGKRFDEQLELLRQLWTRDVVSYSGRFHQLEAVGIGRRPTVVPPLWLGGGLIEPNLRRIVQYADGWLPAGDPTDQLAPLRHRLQAAGRDPDAFGVCARLDLRQGDTDAWVGEARRWQHAGVTQILVDPGDPGSPAEAAELVSNAVSVLNENIQT